MNEMLKLLLPWVSGVLLGVLYFGGLWWTVRKGVSAKRPATWFLGSMLLRMSIALSGFYFIANGRWQNLLLGLLGFVMARFMLTRFTRVVVKPTNGLAGEAGRAS